MRPHRKKRQRIPVVIWTCARDWDLAQIAGQSAIDAGAAGVVIVTDPTEPTPPDTLFRGMRVETGNAERNGNLNGAAIIEEIAETLIRVAGEFGALAAMKLDSDTIIRDIAPFEAAPCGRHRAGGGAFYGAAVSYTVEALQKGLAAWKSNKSTSDQPEDLAIWEIAGSPIIRNSDGVLTSPETAEAFVYPLIALSAGNPKPDGTRKSPEEIASLLKKWLTRN
jgi:hypothetical protein